MMKVCSEETSIPKLAIRPSSVQDLLRMNPEDDVFQSRRPSSIASRRTFTRSPTPQPHLKPLTRRLPQPVPQRSAPRTAPIDPDLPEFGLVTEDRRRRGCVSSVFMVVNQPPLTKYQLKNGTLGRLSTEPAESITSSQSGSKASESDDDEESESNSCKGDPARSSLVEPRPSLVLL